MGTKNFEVPAPRASSNHNLLECLLLELEPMVGIEPTTYGLRNRCSATELLWCPQAAKSRKPNNIRHSRDFLQRRATDTEMQEDARKGTENPVFEQVFEQVISQVFRLQIRNSTVVSPSSLSDLGNAIFCGRIEQLRGVRV